ncbi:MAG: HipA N-terminal domain-containing protein [Bacteroidales bacterium]|nr:HipA N-terminal domain-containing protein [Bacteroidales bacterium]
MRKAKVLFKNEEAGELIQLDDGSFNFTYSDSWITDSSKQSISLTLPKSTISHVSEFLFPFFYNMLPEGTNKNVICSQKHIDSNDHFGLLMTVAENDSIGAVQIVKSV